MVIYGLLIIPSSYTLDQSVGILTAESRQLWALLLWNRDTGRPAQMDMGSCNMITFKTENKFF